MVKIQYINSLFERFANFIVRFRYIVLVLFVLVLGIGFTGLGRVTTDAGWDKWMLDDSTLKLSEDQFKEIFGNNDYVGVLVSADNLFQHRNLSLIRELGRELEDKVPFADKILSITDCEFSLGDKEGIRIGNLVPDPIPSDSAVLTGIRDKVMSKPLLADKLVTKDARQSWIILRLHPFPEGWRSEDNLAADMVVGRTAAGIIRQEKYAPINPKSSGMPIIAYDKTSFFKAEINRTLAISMLVSLVVLTVALRSLRGIFSTVLVAAGALILTFGIQGWVGKPIDVSMVMVPLYLGIAVSISYSIHLIIFFNRDFAATGRRKEAVCRAVKKTGWPILFTALTTIVALSSFHFVGVKPVRWVGFFASMLLAIVFFMVMILIPALLSFGKDRKKPAAPAGTTAKPSVNQRINLWLESVMARLADLALGRSKLIMGMFIVLALISSSGLFFFEVNFDLRKNMGLKIPYVNRLDQISRSELGSLYSYNLVVEFPEANMALEPQNLKKLDLLDQTAKGFELTKQTNSITQIIKDINQVLNQGDPDFYTIPDSSRMVAQLMLLYQNSGGSEAERWIDYEARRLRLMVDLKDYNNREVHQELEDLSQKARGLFPEARISLAGSIVQLTVMQDVVAKGQLTSFLIAIGVITLLMTLVFANLKIGLIAMIPNIAPAVAIGGIMGWADIPLDMMTMTIMPMLLGLAVDDTIHFITHAKHAFEKDRNYRTSVKRTFVAVGLPMLFTSLILTANFSVYLTSPARVHIYIGFLTGTGIMTALLTDYSITPVLLKALNAFGREREPLPQDESLLDNA